MRTLIRIIILLIIIIISGLIALPFFIDPNDYKNEISEQVKNITGRNLALDGDIHLSVFPWIALEMGPLSLSNATGFKTDPFAKVETAEIRIKLMPLLNKQLEMDTIVLDGLVLNLEKNADGKTNWDDLVENAEHIEELPESTDDKGSDTSTPVLAGISIAGVKLSNAHIYWSDASKGEQFQLNKFNLTTDPLVPGKPTKLDMNFDLSSNKPQAKAHITLATNIMVDMDNQHYALTGLSFTTQVEGKELPVNTANISLQGNIDADMVKQLINIDNFEVKASASNQTQRIDNFILTGQVTADLAAQMATIKNLSLQVHAEQGEQAIVAKLNANIKATLDGQKSTISSLKLTSEITDPAMPGGKVNIDVSGNVTTDLQKQTASLSDLVIAVHDLLINANVDASKLLSENPNFSGQLDIKPFNLRQLANKLAIELPPMADGSTLELVQLNTKFEGSSNHFNAKSLSLMLDQSKLNGQLAIKDFTKPAVNFKLMLDEIDLDRYLPPVSKEDKQATAASPATTAVAASNELPLETLRQLNAKGTIDIGKLKVSGLQTENIHLTLNADKGLIKLHPMKAEMYQGNYQGNIQLNAQGKVLKLSIDEQLKGVQIGPILKVLSGDDKITGTVHANVNLTGAGITPDGIKKTLSGKGDFAFTNGAIKGINIADSIRQAKVAITGKKLPPSDKPVQTDFSEITGSFTAKNGVIQNKDLKASSPLLRINGAGTINLVKELLDYAVNVSIVETSKGQGGKELADLTGLTIPVKITGSFDNPAVNVDLANLLKAQANKELQKKALEQADKLKLKEKFGVDLNDLLGGGATPQKDESKPKSDSKPAEKSTPAPSTSPEDQIKDVFKKFF